MPGIISTRQINDGANTAFPNGMRYFDVSGTGAGPWVPVSYLYDPANGTLGTIKPASTAPTATDPALVVALSPNGLNANVHAVPGVTRTASDGAPTVNFDPYSQYKPAPAGATTLMGATGAQYDYLAGVVIVPGTTAAGAVSIADGNGTAIQIFAGGATTALSDLKPFAVPLGFYALATTTPGWRITTGTNVTAIGVGQFT